MKYKNCHAIIFAIVIITLLVFSCSDQPSTEYSEVSFDISMMDSKAMVTADVSIPSAEELYWKCEAIGTEGVEFSERWATKGLSNKKVKVRTGDYVITLKAYNDSNQEVLSGSKSVTLSTGRNTVSIKMNTKTGGFVYFTVSGHLDGDACQSPALKFVERNGNYEYFAVFSSQMTTDESGDLVFNSIEKSIASKEDPYEWDIVLYDGATEKLRKSFNIMLYENFPTQITVDIRSTSFTISVDMPSADIVEIL